MILVRFVAESSGKIGCFHVILSLPFNEIFLFRPNYPAYWHQAVITGVDCGSMLAMFVAMNYDYGMLF